MKKSRSFDELSDRVCAVKGCNKRLKLRVIELKPDADLCFCHHQELVRKNPRYKNGKKVSRHPHQHKQEVDRGES